METLTFENALVWTGPKTDKERAKGEKTVLRFFGSYFNK